MTWSPSFTLRLRLVEAETRVTKSGRETVALHWDVVQQPEFGRIHDYLAVDRPHNEFAQEKISQLLEAMRVPLEPGRMIDSLDLVDRLLARRRYVLAVVQDREWDGGHAWTVRRYFRTAPR